MTLKVSSWHKTCDTEWMPNCLANDILNVITKNEKYMKLVYDDEIDLGLCWEYFDRTYKCYCLEPKYGGTIEDYIYNLNNFQFSFRELDSSAQDNRIFTMKKDKECNMACKELDYVSDICGFALLKLRFTELRVHYYDFEQLFSSSIKIQISNNAIGEIKLCCRSIWIINNMYNDSYVGCFIDMISIKNEREWYHVRSNTCVPISLSRVFSSIMVLADDITNELDYEEDSLNFSSCKVLLIDHNNLVPYERNDRSFIDFDKPKGCETDSLVVYGIFKSTIILSPSDNPIDPEVWYFLRYNEKMQLSFFKRTDFTISMKDEIGIYWGYSVAIIPHIGKMFLITSSNSILVFDVKTFQVSQVLEYTLPYSPGGIFKWSKQDRMLNVVCVSSHPDQRWYLKYALYGGQTLKQLALNAVVEVFSIEKIQASNLPHSLFREIMTRKMY